MVARANGNTRTRKTKGRYASSARLRPNNTTTISGMSRPRTVCHAEKISVSGCKRPSSSRPCVNPGAACGGEMGGSGGGSDPIVAPDDNQMIAQFYGLVGVQARDHDCGFVGTGCMQQEGCQSQ